MPHICHIFTTYKKRASIVRRTAVILQECVKRGYKVTLIVGANNDSSSIRGVDVIKIPVLYKHISLLDDYRAYKQIKQLLESLKPDIVHTHQAKAGVLGRLAAHAVVSQSKILHTVHGPTFPLYFPFYKRAIYRLAERLVGKYTHKFVFIGDELKQEYIAGNVCNDRDSIVIKTGKPEELIKRVRLSEKQKNVLRAQLCSSVSPPLLITYVARIVPGKKLEDAIELLCKLRESGLDVHLALVGKALIKKEIDYEVCLRRLVEDKNLFDYVHFSGFYENIYDVMESSDLIVLTSAYEGLSNVAIESLLLSVPLLSYEVAGLKELAIKMKGGLYIVEQGNISALVDMALEIFKNRSSQKVALLDGLGRLRADHDIKTMLSKKMDLYEKIIMGEE